MSAINLENLPLASDQARAARNYFGLSQAEAAKESGLPLHKLKRFEARPMGDAGSYIPDGEFLQDLRDFYEKRGFRFDDTEEPGSNAKKTGLVFPSGVVGGTDKNQGGTKGNRPNQATFHHMRIALEDPEMGRVLDLIEANEDKIRDMLDEPVKEGFWSGLSDETQARHGQALKMLAANGLLFAKLFGRDVGGQPEPKILDGTEPPKTQADLLHKVNADTHLAVSGDASAQERLKKTKPAQSLLSAIFG